MVKPRIYIAISTFHPFTGGAERQALLQATRLRARGYEATIMTLRHEDAWPYCELIDNVPVIRVAGRPLSLRRKLPAQLRPSMYGLALMHLAWSLWRRRQCYDVIHVYQLNALAVVCAVVCLLTGARMVVGVRAAASYVGGLAECSSQEAVGASPPHVAPAQDAPQKSHVRAWTGGDLEQLERLGRPAVWLARGLLSRSGAVVVVLSSQMNAYLASHGLLLPETRLIPNGVDITWFYPGDTPIAQRPQIVVCVARLQYQKGIDVLLQAWRQVHTRVQGARLVLVGNGPLLGSLTRQAAMLEIAESVDFMGLQSDVRVPLWQANVAVLPSRFEGMSNALLVAMACGLPCVATRVSGSEDLIEDGVNGLLVEPGDDEGLAKALLTVLANPNLARTFGRAARATIERHYALEHMIDQYADLYQTVVHAKQAEVPTAADVRPA